MEDFYEVKKHDREYLIVFKELLPKSKVYMLLRECHDQIHEEVLREMSRLALSSSAKQIYLRDQIWEKEERSQITAGDFRFFPSHCIEKMELTHRDYQRYRQGREKGTSLKMKRLTMQNAFVFMQIYNDSFFEISNSATYRESELEEIIDNKELHAYILYEQEFPVGVCQLRYTDEENYIDFIGVNPQVQGKGYGRMMLHLIAEQFFGQGCEKIQLLVSDDNLIAKQLYLSLGFKKITIFGRWYRLERKDGLWTD